ncbi:hypothetical protein [Bradyrhizobium sp. NBAIM01]|uniref:hypothetical protein n=1 Tax=Bradyrhizobium sp. NBAIM01 TaxID=2793818 RepID=UPI001CD457B4|nr:hypothetical protein [Bradyrhizobium sp. NBAIM01]MCA1511100.1 hypothetical protein [Bradyrhizobium sp. NBAIM01]
MWSFLLAATFGATAQELLHWYDLRGKLASKRLRALIYSKEYWIITILVIMVSPLCCWFLFGGGAVSDQTAFLAGAAFPLVFKKGVSAFASKDQVVLGDASIRDYFLLFTQPRA